MDKDLQRYLNGHLSGSHRALSLIGELTQRQTVPEEAAFYSQLGAKVENDHGILTRLLGAIRSGEGNSSLPMDDENVKTTCLMFLDTGLEPGMLGTFEALEMLALGIQGKRLLWVALQEVTHHFPEWSEVDFQALEFDAIRQREAVEDRRLMWGREALACPIRKEANIKKPAA